MHVVHWLITLEKYDIILDLKTQYAYNKVFLCLCICLCNKLMGIYYVYMGTNMNTLSCAYRFD